MIPRFVLFIISLVRMFSTSDFSQMGQNFHNWSLSIKEHSEEGTRVKQDRSDSSNIQVLFKTNLKLEIQVLFKNKLEIGNSET